MPPKNAKSECSTAAQKPIASGIDLPMAVGPVAVQAWMEIGTEAVRFVWDRLQHDIKTQQAMLTCTSLDDMWNIQAEFFTATQAQYAAGAAKMLDRMGKLTAAGLTATAKARRYDDVPL